METEILQYLNNPFKKGGLRPQDFYKLLKIKKCDSTQLKNNLRTLVNEGKVMKVGIYYWRKE